ncbi:MAG: C-type lectin lectoxin-Lio2-like [Deltaproteobacteria bacterium]|nr:C-type lectin lectoxin-Lio2-like [Deltaproteobacteria bacterium]
MFRALVVVALLPGCGVTVATTGAIDAAGSDAEAVDAPPPVDASIDARPCSGGDQSGTGPDGSCFLLFSTPTQFVDAKAACEANASHLAILRTEADDTFAEQFIGTLDTLIGLTDQAVENTFVWTDGSAVTFSNFRTGEPNNGAGGFEEDCILIAGERAGKGWDDRPCAPVTGQPGGLYAYLCQF